VVDPLDGEWFRRTRVISVELLSHLCDGKRIKLWGSTDTIVLERLLDYAAGFNETNWSRFRMFVRDTIPQDSALVAYYYYRHNRWRDHWGMGFLPSPVVQTSSSSMAIAMATDH
jgi:predicted ester cyclase